MALLEAVPRVEHCPYVFAGEKPDRPRSDLKRPWAMVTRAAGLEGVRLHDLRHTFASRGAAVGMRNDGFAGSEIADVMVGGKGDDVLVGAGGSDIYVYARGDGNDWIVDRSTAAGETDTRVLRDLNRADVTFSRMGNTLIVTVTATGHKIEIASIFEASGPNGDMREGVEFIRFADGSTINRTALIREARYTGDSEFGMSISGEAGDTVLRGGASNDIFSSVGTSGTDVIMFGRGDGNDVVVDLSLQIEGRTIVQLKQTRCAKPRNTGSATSGLMHQGRVPSLIAKPWETRGQRHQAEDIKLVS